MKKQIRTKGYKMYPYFADPKGVVLKGLINHVKKKIRDLEFQRETITPVSGLIQNEIDLKKITQIKEEIEMLKNELLVLENDQ